jgi:ABC-type antimicrobial peptide transport system permease subunit
MDVQWLVLRQGLGVAVAGVVVGLALALAASSAVQGIVLTGGTFDITVFTTAAAVLVAAVLVASWLPARRATRVSATSFMRS